MVKLPSSLTARQDGETHSAQRFLTVLVKDCEKLCLVKGTYL